jgi:hypothetical protein
LVRYIKAQTATRIKQAVSRDICQDKSRAKRLEQGGRREAPRY